MGAYGRFMNISGRAIVMGYSRLGMVIVSQAGLSMMNRLGCRGHVDDAGGGGGGKRVHFYDVISILIRKIFT